VLVYSLRVNQAPPLPCRSLPAISCHHTFEAPSVPSLSSPLVPAAPPKLPKRHAPVYNLIAFVVSFLTSVQDCLSPFAAVTNFGRVAGCIFTHLIKICPRRFQSPFAAVTSWSSTSGISLFHKKSFSEPNFLCAFDKQRALPLLLSGRGELLRRIFVVLALGCIYRRFVPLSPFPSCLFGLCLAPHDPS